MPTNPERQVLSETESQAGIIADSRRSRPLFFDGKFLTAADLNGEQAYVLNRQADLAKTLGFGVVTGLSVQRATADANSSIQIDKGLGLTPTGETVWLPSDVSNLNLANIPLLEGLNAAFGLSRVPQQTFLGLSGLFVVGLRAVEYSANPTAVFPASLQANQNLQDGEIIEATAITLVPYDGTLRLDAPLAARAQAAREIFLDQRPPRLPADVLPLAMVYLHAGALHWVDSFLVRREAGDDDRFGFGFAPKALAEAHFLHYQSVVDELPATQQQGSIAASDHFEILPPGGPLPRGAINLDDFTQAFFPPDANVQLAFVPEDELPGLMDESLNQPPIDLRATPQDQDALQILVLAPVPRSKYRATLQGLGETTRRTLTPASPALLGQLRPLDRLAQLQAASKLRILSTDSLAKVDVSNPSLAPSDATAIRDAAWVAGLKEAPRFWYVRQRILPYASDGAAQALTAKSLPAIISGPDSLTVDIGKQARFCVYAAGAGTLTYQWFKDGDPVPNATLSELVVPSAQPQNRGNYTVTVKNDFGDVTSRPAALDVVTPIPPASPIITTHPMDGTAPNGTGARFEVVASGTLPLNYQWTKDGKDLDKETQPILTLPNVSKSHEGKYAVRVWNTGGSVISKSASLVVPAVPDIVPPKITLQPEGTLAHVGTRAILSVGVEGSTPMTIQWHRDTGPIPGANGPFLVIENIQDSDAQSYHVVVTNAGGSVTSNKATLAIDRPPQVTEPTILTQPTSIKASRGSDVLFKVEVGGTAPFQYQWKKDNAEIPGATQSSHRVQSVKDTDAGVYSVVVRNDLKTKTVVSEPATLLVTAPDTLDKPSIVSDPVGLSASEGSDVRLAVDFRGTAPIEFEWQHNGKVILRGTDPVLVLEKVGAANAGSYTVKLTNDAGSVTSLPAVVSIVAPPKAVRPSIVVQPRSYAASPGGDALFTVTAAGTAPFFYQWKKNGAPQGEESDDPTLRIPSVNGSHVGEYEVVVRNEVDSITSTKATLTLQPAAAKQPPLIMRQPAGLSVSIGSNVQFSVEASGLAPLRFQWFKDDKELTGETKLFLSLPAVQATQAGIYKVLVKNDDGEVMSSGASLSFFAEAPVQAVSILEGPRSIDASAGSNVAFSVRVAGDAPIYYQWRKNGAPFGGESTSPTLRLAAVEVSDEGRYDVIVRNAAGPATSSQATLRVQPALAIQPPVIDRQPYSVWASIGKSTQFSVGVSGVTPFEFQWMCNGTALLGETGPVLSLASVQAIHAGTYKVRVRNGGGQVTSAEADLYIPSPPAAEPLRVDEGLRDITAHVGMNVELTVRVAGSAPVNFAWTKDGVPVPNANGPSLVRNRITAADAGRYRVTVQNPNSPTQPPLTSEATVTVLPLPLRTPPSIDRQPSGGEVPLGSPVTLTVAVSGSAPFRFEWYKNGSILLPGNNGPSLTLPSVGPGDSGSYSVKVSNDAGNITSESVMLTVASVSTVGGKCADEQSRVNRLKQIQSNLAVRALLTTSGSEKEKALADFKKATEALNEAQRLLDVCLSNSNPGV